MKDYTEQPIYLGIDVHKKTYSITAISQGVVVKRDKISASPNMLIAYCNKFFPNGSIFSAYEAGFSGFYLHRLLIAAGIHNIVVHAASIEIAARDRVKTDKRDSLKIATQLAAGRLKCINIPSVEREAYRFITRLREKLIRDRTRLGVQIKSFLNLNGLISYKETKRISRKWIVNFIKPQIESDISFYLNVLAKRWLEVDDDIKEIGLRLDLQANQETELEIIYQSVPGIGPIASRVLINELGDMSQFTNEKKLFSFTGLTPQEYSSGENTRQGHISRQGRAILRKILVQASWRAIRNDNELRQVFERISIKAGAKRAIVATARRLIGHVRACLLKKEKYRYKEVSTTNIV